MATKKKDEPGSVAKDVKAYLDAVPEQFRPALENLRKTIRSIVPGASEVISYGIPTFKTGERMLVSYAAFTKHCSLFAGASPISTFEKELTEFRTSRGTIQFTPDKPLPASLVKKIMKLRAAENAARMRK